MDLLAEQLNDYSRHGIPRLPHLLSFEADEDTEEALYRYASPSHFHMVLCHAAFIIDLLLFFCLSSFLYAIRSRDNPVWRRTGS